MPSHGGARRQTENMLAAREPFKRSGFAMWAMEGASSGTGIMPEPHRAQYLKDASNNDIGYTVLSYATPILWTLRDGTIVCPDVKYSLTTTQHQRMARAHVR